MPHVLVAGKIHEAGLNLLRSAPGVTVDTVEEVSTESYAPKLPQADALLIRTQPLPGPVVATASRLKVVSRHFGVSKGDILSQRRHRSVVWPRQIGMYLDKQLTSRSLPKIGRRFGNRDHTTVLHAIRKIEGELEGNPRLRDELEELKKLLSN